MSAVPEKWLDLAIELENCGGCEGKMRASCNRSYYAVFHLLNALVLRCIKGTSIPPGFTTLSHSDVRDGLGAWSSRNQSQRLGMQLGTRGQLARDNFERLMQSRHRADYDLRTAFVASELDAHKLRVQKALSFCADADKRAREVGL